MVNDLMKVYRMLEDDVSKEIYLHRMNYLLTGQLKCMYPVIEKYLPDLKRSDRELWEDLENDHKDQNVILWGCGTYVRSNMSTCFKVKRLAAFCDRARCGENIRGIPVISPDQLYENYTDEVVVISTSNYYLEIERDLLAHGIKPENIVYLGHYVEMCSHRQYLDEPFLKFGQNTEEVFVDAGAYDLFNTLKLKEMCGANLIKSYAFEPDPDNYKRCMQRKEELGMDYAELFPYAVWDKKEELHFNNNGSAQASVTDDGGMTLDAVPIDDIVKHKVTFIKMDIEGAEMAALRGARNTIIRDKPKLAICMYHKPEDMTEVPLYIKSLVPEYKCYVRHYSNYGYETVFYAII